MESISFSGPTEVNALEEAYIAKVVHDLEADEFNSGGAFGVDSKAALYAWAFHREAKHRLIVPKGCWHNEKLVEILSKHPSITVEYVEGGYMRRNDRLVEACTRLVALPRTSREELRSGTWATIRRARKAGVPVDIYPLSDA